MSNPGRAGLIILSLSMAVASISCSENQIQEVSYSLVEGWAELPEGIEAWGQTIGVEIDTGGNLLVFQRCFASNCIGRDEVPAFLKYNSDGKLIDSWGEGMFVWPHGFFLDVDGNIWTTDARGREGKGQQVLKFSPDGRVLMALGTPGVAGDGPNTLSGPTDIAVAPTGEIFVADGHGNNRIVKYSSNGEFLMEWGQEGTGPGDFNEPHCLAFDSKGRLFVGDRVNQRIQVFDQDGRYLAEWPNIMASGMHITQDDVVYVADYQLREGIVIANASDFSEVGFISEALPEGVAVDTEGNVYAGEVLPRNLKKFAKTLGPPTTVPRDEEIMNESGNSLMTFVNGSSITRRAMLLSLPGIAFAPRLMAKHQVAPLSIVGLQQITLAVSDIERSLAFYQELFGVSVQARHEKSVLLRLGTGPHFLALTEAESAAPRIDHFGMAVEGFDVDQVLETLGSHGITGGESSGGLSGGSLRVRVVTRDGTPEIYLGDPNGLVIQLQDPKYCGGSGPLGDDCAALEPAPDSGSLELIGLSHLTINVSDPESTNAFYQGTFGMDVQAFQAASPLMGVGQGSDFLMFISLGRTGRGNTLPAQIHHACLTVEDFDVLRIQNALEEHGIRPRGTGPDGSGPLRHWVSMRMPNRGGVPEGTPELYFSDPDGLSIQLQDVRYCGGGGYLGESC